MDLNKIIGMSSLDKVASEDFSEEMAATNFLFSTNGLLSFTSSYRQLSSAFYLHLDYVPDLTQF